MAPVTGTPSYHCGICPSSFKSRSELQAHMRDHKDSAPAQHKCIVCKWTFEDTLHLEKHKISTGHGETDFKCDECGKSFSTARALSIHNKPPMDCSNDLMRSPSAGPMAVNICDRCSESFKSRRDLMVHRRFPSGCSDAFHHGSRTQGTDDYEEREEQLISSATTLVPEHKPARAVTVTSDHHTTLSADDVYCATCKKSFTSMSRYQMHTLSCRAQNLWGSETDASSMDIPLLPSFDEEKKRKKEKKKKNTNMSGKPDPEVKQHPEVKQQQPPHQPRPNPARVEQQPPLQPVQPVKLPSTNVIDSPAFVCEIQGCGKHFRSQPALTVHQQDAHAVGGEGLDLYGKDSWMMNQKTREAAKHQGLLRPAHAPALGLGRGGLPPTTRLSSAPLPRATQVVSRTLPSIPAPRPAQSAFRAPVAPQQAPLRHASAQAPTTRAIRDNIGGPEESEQAKYIHGKIIRLLIQADVHIQHYGKITIGDIEWSRIGVARQADVPGSFEKMCHLPKFLQDEYLPSPKTFAEDYTSKYLGAEFKPSPAPNPAKPAMRVVAIACSKILLEIGCEDIVKIAAVDVTTCRILLDHFVCTDPKVRVAKWRTGKTGINSWSTLEKARGERYRVFRGWQAVRAALWKFIDKDTIIVGHNLRADLDVLRMIHGRAVDVAKVAEKAADGPLSKIQLSLDSLSRDFPGIRIDLNRDQYGRDVLVDAFAARELGLWIIKNTEKFEKSIRQKSVDYQRLMPGKNGA